MKFGNDDRFAIEVNIPPIRRDLWLMGRVSYKINGQYIGDFAKETALSDILVQSISVLKDRNNRLAPLLIDLPKNETFGIIRSCLFEDNERLYNYLCQGVHAASLSILPPIEVFFKWSVFLIDGKQLSRILYSEYPFGEIGELMLDFDEFDKIFLSFYQYLNEEYRLRGGVPTELGY